MHPIPTCLPIRLDQRIEFLTGWMLEKLELAGSLDFRRIPT